MKDTYIIQQPAGQMTPSEAKTANVIEKALKYTFKGLCVSALCTIVAALLVVLCIGVQEMPNRYDKAVAQYQKHQMLNEKFKATSLNE